MKSTILYLLLSLIFAGSAAAQLNTLGLDRSIGGSGMFQGSKNKETKKETLDLVKASADKMEKQLLLDAFQKAAVINYIDDFKNSVISLESLDIPEEGKMEKINIEKEKMEAKILAILKPEQVEKFQDLKNKKGKKGKKK